MSTTTPPPSGPPAGRFDPVTGEDLRPGAGSGKQRRESFALQSGEPVFSFNLVTSMLPLASGNAPQTYRWAIAFGVLIPVIAGALGFLAFAFVAAALAVPAIYVVYMYDVNQWEDQPVPVVLGTMGLAALLGIGFTFLWHGVFLGDSFTSTQGGVEWKSLLVLCLLVPVVGELLKQVGPVALASRPAFDDMIDGLTFGVAAGAAFAAAETIVVNGSLFGALGRVDNPNAGFWISLILSAAIIKPIVYGAATGIAVAAYSGLGEGYDGFKPGYVRGLAEALGANIVFQAGLFAAAKIGGTTGAVVGLVWGVLVAGFLVIRLRYMLHFAVLEAAQEAATKGASLKDTVLGTAYCPSCELPMAAGHNFCAACGTTTRAASKVTRRRNRDDDGGVADATVAPDRDHKQTALVVGSVVAVLVAGGFVAQGAAAAAAGNDQPPTISVDLKPNLDSGPQTETQPDSAPAPGPSVDPSVSPSDGASGAAYHAPSTAATSTRALLAAPKAGTATTDVSTDGTVTIGGDVVFTPADGWEVTGSADTEVLAATPGATFNVVTAAGPTDDATLLAGEMAYVQNERGFEQVEFAPPEELTPPSSAFVSASRAQFQAVVASQQQGTIALYGLTVVLTRQDGSGIVVTAVFNQDMLTDGDDSPVVQQIGEMLNGIVSSVG